MVKIGYALSNEEHDSIDLVNLAVRAEENGFEFAFISDHYHPWLEVQGNSPFVWSVLGAIARSTSKIRIGTGVTCPILRIHPAIIAQASATVAEMFEGRFKLGLGTGENLNEHVIGLGWPTISERQEMLIEAIKIIRRLWSGEVVNFSGTYYIVEDAKIYNVPQDIPKILIAASGPKSASLAGKYADGFITTSPDKNLVEAYNAKAENNLPKYGQLTIAYAETEEKGISLAFKYWKNTGLKGQLNSELRTTTYFEQATKMVKRDDIANQIVVGPNIEKYIDKIKEYEQAGFTHVYLHQIGPKQDKFMEFCKNQLLPKLK